jgi:hypothetical protein
MHAIISGTILEENLVRCPSEVSLLAVILRNIPYTIVITLYIWNE